MKHIIAILLENEPGALSRVVGLFSARGYNIESLTVAPTEDPSLSRMTLQTNGSDDVIDQIPIIETAYRVVKVGDLTEGATSSANSDVQCALWARARGNETHGRHFPRSGN